MKSKKETFGVTVQAETAERCEQLAEILREHYDVVVSTGMRQNNHPPRMNWWRAYYTVIIEGDDDE